MYTVLLIYVTLFSIRDTFPQNNFDQMLHLIVRHSGVIQ